MADYGYRSVEIQLIHFFNSPFAVQSYQSKGWIDGEEPRWEETFMRGEVKTWGAKTDDAQGSASFLVVLTGIGGMTITATNTSSGESSVRFSNVSAHLSPSYEPAEGSTADHSRFHVYLSPV